MTRRYTTGDTIVEVILAFAVFSAVAMGAVLMMNKGLGVAQRTLETTLVRQQVDTQADLLRYIRNANSPAWRTLVTDLRKSNSGSEKVADVSEVVSATSRCTVAPPKSFVLYFASGTVQVAQLNGASSYHPAVMHSYVDDTTGNSYGMWVELVEAQGSVPGAMMYDAYIRGCWAAPGQENPAVAGTIVRLYEK